MYLVVGLGNPGSKYSRTRHNAGFMVLDELAGRHGETFKSKRKAEVAQVAIGGEKVVLAKPLTFMNLSGEAVKKLRRHYRLSPENVLVVHDDIDMAPGQIRIRAGGSTGGHLGVRSIMEHLGSDRFPRIKVGVGRPPTPEEAADHVLSKVESGEMEKLEEAVMRAADAVEALISEGPSQAMNRFN